MAFLQAFWSQHKSLVKFCMVVGIFTLIAMRIDWHDVENLAANIKGGFFSIALILMIVQVLMLALRWMYFMNAEERLVNYDEALNITVASQIANFLFITSVGGVVVRLFLARHFGLSLLKSICAVVTDRFMTLIAILSFAVLFLPILAKMLPYQLLHHTYFMLGIFIPICILTPFVATKIIFPYIRRNKSLHSSAVYLKRLFEKPDIALPILLTSFISQGAFFIAGCMAAKAIGLEVNLINFLALLPFISLASSLPIGFGGWGIREGAFIVGLKFLGVPMEMAFLISIQVGILSILATFVTAIPLMFTGDLAHLIKLSGRFGDKSSPNSK